MKCSAVVGTVQGENAGAFPGRRVILDRDGARSAIQNVVKRDRVCIQFRNGMLGDAHLACGYRRPDKVEGFAHLTPPPRASAREAAVAPEPPAGSALCG